jgi:Ca2+-binding RTX toxin-like protein
MNRILTLTAAIAALLIVPSAASASQVSLVPGDEELPPQLQYFASPGEANKLNVTVAADGRSAEVSDPGAGTITPGSNCTAQNAKKVTCTLPAGQERIGEVDAELGDGNDTFDVSGAGSSANGGVGNDELRGGAGRDFFDGGSGTDELRGGDADDQLFDGDVTGQSVNSDTFVGGPGNDFVTYADRTAPVTVDLAGAGGEGEAGENDQVSEVENVTGGRNKDIIRGDAGVNVLQGLGEDDLLEGRDGNDYLGGSDGNDTLVPGAGLDDAEAGDGNDILRLENPPGQRDRLLTCGAGKDTIIGLGPAPSVAIDCELGDYGSGFVIGLKPKKVTTEVVTVKIPCPDAFKRDGVCKGSIVVEPTGAYNRSEADRKKQRYGAKSFKITKSTKVSIRLNSAGRKQLRKSAFKLQFTINMKETATGTKRRFEWTSYLVRQFL